MTYAGVESLRRFFQALLLDMENACPLKYTASVPELYEGPDSTGPLFREAFELAKEALHRPDTGLTKNQQAYAYFSISVQVHSITMIITVVAIIAAIIIATASLTVLHVIASMQWCVCVCVCVCEQGGGAAWSLPVHAGEGGQRELRVHHRHAGGRDRAGEHDPQDVPRGSARAAARVRRVAL
jgi:hypothetical protein